jgi:hypothetical protein
MLLQLRPSTTLSNGCSKLAAFPLKWMWMSASMRFAVDAWPCRLGRRGDGETQCSKVRSDIVQDGPSLRSQ